MSRFWVYIDSKIQGPVDIPALRKVGGFNLLTQVCAEGEQSWRMADDVIEIKSYFLSPPRPNSFALDSGNAAPQLDLVLPPIEEIMPPELKIVNEKPAPLQSGGPVGIAGLRAVCPACEYKNPRDVTVCMKCGETLNTPVSQPISSSSAAAAMDPSPMDARVPLAGMKNTAMPMSILAAPTPPPPATPPPEPNAGLSPTVEIPMSKLLLGIAMAAVLAGGSFFGYRSWIRKHPSKHAAATAASAAPAKRTSVMATRSPKRYARPPIHHKTPYDPDALPGVSQEAAPPAQPNNSADENEGASYRVVAEATPLQKRYSSPLNSAYAVKRRGNEELWSTQEGHAIQQVQRNRIYGGLRTVERNREILMQILRDREYNTAFESGKRLYLYNDSDWSAVQKEGPVYEVRLTFSGGKEADGSPKKPLHFAFAADLERGTVEPGGQDQRRSNTLHAFFDESRIAPEDRRAIAKDTEELVLAAQPGASPLAFDTVVRQFAKVYSTDALSRVAEAYSLRDVKKKLAHDPRLGADDTNPSAHPVSPVRSILPGNTGNAPKPFMPPDQAKPTLLLVPSKGGAVDYRMEKGSGRERTFLLRAVSHASVNRLWETLTGYDRLKQFVPDMLASEREGQDGAATIVHTVYLTRMMFFVFKVNLHLRVIEHPQQHQLEFERIAGDFESFRGSIEVGTDPATHDTQIAFHATLVPSGHGFNWGLEGMARKLLVTQLDAIRSKSESQ